MTTEQRARLPLGLLVFGLASGVALAQGPSAPPPATRPKAKRTRGPGYFVQLPVTPALRAFAARVGKALDRTERKVEHRRYPPQVLPDDGLAGVPPDHPDRFSAESVSVAFDGFAVERLKFARRQVALDWAATLSLGRRGAHVWRLVEVRGRHVLHVVGGAALDRVETLRAARTQGWAGLPVRGQPDLLRLARGEALALSARNDGGLLRATLDDVLLAVQASAREGERRFPVGASPIAGAKEVRLREVDPNGRAARAEIAPVGVLLEVQRDDQLLRCRVGRAKALKRVMRAFKRLAPEGLKRKVAFPAPSEQRIPPRPVPIEQAGKATPRR